MRLRARRAAAAGIGAILLCSTPAPAQPRIERPRPKLVVLLVVDQMRADYVDQFRHQWTGGLRRLLERGAWFRQVAYPYLNTYTCVGHATISTGVFPATHGIVGNTWWDREAGEMVTCTEDAQARRISSGPAANGGNSAWRLAVPTFAEELRAQAGASSRVVTFSLKARSAIMLAGHHADVVTWHDARNGAWVTSSAYASSPVAFVKRVARMHPVEADFGKSWTRALSEDAYLFEDAAFGEKPPLGWNPVFPHVLKGNSSTPDAAFYRGWEASPFSDAYLGQLAKAAVDTLGLGKGRGVDFLGVSFSALDLVGHVFGPRSHEVQDVLARLDRTIGALLEHLDRAVGPGNYIVALTADHGVAPIPEQMAHDGYNAGRISPTDLAERIEKSLDLFLGAGRKVARVNGNDVYFAPGVIQEVAANRAAMRAVTDAILAAPGISRVFWSEEVRELPASGDPMRRAAALSYSAGRSGDLVVVPEIYWFVAEKSLSLATTHGTAYGYDQRVPVFLMGAGVRAGEYLTAATPADIAPTLALLCGITLGRSDGRVLAEALKGRPAPATKMAQPKR